MPNTESQADEETSQHQEQKLRRSQRLSAKLSKEDAALHDDPAPPKEDQPPHYAKTALEDWTPEDEKADAEIEGGSQI